MDNLDFILSLFSQYLFTDAKANIEDIEYYFTTNINTRDNNLIKELVYSIKTYSLENIDIPLFQSICSRCGKTDAESQDIINKLIQWKQYDSKKMEPARKYLQDLCSAAVIQRANKLYPNDPTEYLNYLKKSEIKTSRIQDCITTNLFNELDINSLVANEDSCGVPSYFEFLNRSFAPHNVIEFGQMGCISMPPGTGKSLFAMTEALNMSSRGYKVHYIAMGDLKINDFITRLAAIYSGLPFYEARKNITGIYTGLSKIIGDKLGITCIPSGKITVEEYIEYIKDTDYQVLFIDYDAGFANPTMNESMYLAMGDTYDKLTELTALGKLVFILAQPMKASWDLESIELNQVGESAKKVHCVDFLLTRGRCVESQNHLGIMTLAKNRRGEEGVKAFSVRLNNGRFRIVPKQVYEELKKVEEKTEWTDSDIDSMIADYQRQMEQINSYKRQANQNPQPNTSNSPVQVPNPFNTK